MPVSSTSNALTFLGGKLHTRIYQKAGSSSGFGDPNSYSFSGSCDAGDLAVGGAASANGWSVDDYYAFVSGISGATVNFLGDEDTPFSPIGTFSWTVTCVDTTP